MLPRLSLSSALAAGRYVAAPKPSVAGKDSLAMFPDTDLPASSTLTREVLGWQPDGRKLIDDLERASSSTDKGDA